MSELNFEGAFVEFADGTCKPLPEVSFSYNTDIFVEHDGVQTSIILAYSMMLAEREWLREQIDRILTERADSSSEVQQLRIKIEKLLEAWPRGEVRTERKAEGEARDGRNPADLQGAEPEERGRGSAEGRTE